MHHPYQSFSSSRGGVHPPGRRRSGRARHQADAVPHEARTPRSSRGLVRRRRVGETSRSSWSRSRPVSTRNATSSGPGASRRPEPHVGYGLVGLKTHAKAVARRPAGGRGHPALRATSAPATTTHKTAGLYEDFGLFNVSSRVRRRSLRPVQLPDRLLFKDAKFRRLSHAPPYGLREEASLAGSNARSSMPAAGRDAHLIFKINNQPSRRRQDHPRQLYEGASQAGVDIDLIIRGICCPPPRHPRAVSRPDPRSFPSWAASSSTPVCTTSTTTAIPEYLIGSADLMPRNLDRRVEQILLRPRRPGSASTELRRSCSTLSMDDAHVDAGTSAPTAGSGTTSPRTAARCSTCRTT